MKIETKTNKNKDCFIIGSGSSLLNLTLEEKEYLNNHPHTLAMNRYLLFFEKIGVFPKDLFLGDYHSVLSHRVFLKTIKKIKKLSIFPNYYVDEYYKDLKNPLFKDFFSLKKRLSFCKKQRELLPLFTSYSNLKLFKARLRDRAEFIWGENLNENLFFHRGSLTTALNLAYIIYPECNIKLIGIDLNNSSSFYEEELKKHPEFVDWKVSQRIKSQNRHNTVIKTEKGTVIDRFHLIQQKLAQNNRKLLCCNPHSLLIQDDICEYSPIIS